MQCARSSNKQPTLLELGIILQFQKINLSSKDKFSYLFRKKSKMKHYTKIVERHEFGVTIENSIVSIRSDT